MRDTLLRGQPTVSSLEPKAYRSTFRHSTARPSVPHEHTNKQTKKSKKQDNNSISTGCALASEA